MKPKSLLVTLTMFLLSGLVHAGDAPTDARKVLSQMLESDPWGFSGAAVSAEAVLSDKSGAESRLAFSAKSRKTAPTLSASLVRFSAPADLSGAGFLQVQKDRGDDERYLYLPDVGRSRRISGSLRKNAFMGTDMSFADLDRRDLRDGTPTLKGSETIAKWDCHLLSVTPPAEKSEYSRVDIWVRKDNSLPMKMEMFDKSGSLIKTFAALEVRRVDGSWFITKSKMVNVQLGHTTILNLNSVSPSTSFEESLFTVRELEKGG